MVVSGIEKKNIVISLERGREKENAQRNRDRRRHLIRGHLIRGSVPFRKKNRPFVMNFMTLFVMIARKRSVNGTFLSLRVIHYCVATDNILSRVTRS